MELPAEDTLQTGLPTHQAAVQLEYSGLLDCAVLYSTLDLDLARYYSCTVKPLARILPQGSLYLWTIGQNPGSRIWQDPEFP